MLFGDQVFDEPREIYLIMAHKIFALLVDFLGLYWFETDLDNLAFAIHIFRESGGMQSKTAIDLGIYA